jgi:polyhydroxyalkanoate synthesis repressor PhaR
VRKYGFARKLAPETAGCKGEAAGMAKTSEPTTIKKYANRRLYNTGTSTYVTLEDLGTMLKAGEDFVVFDAKTNEEITRQVLTQIIFEQESKGQNLLPITFLRQLIRFYGDSMQALVPSFLEFSMDNLARDQQKLRDQMTQQLGGSWTQTPWTTNGFGVLEEQARSNMAMFEKAFKMFAPFAPHGAVAAAEKPPEPAPRPKDGDIDELKKELAEMKTRLDKIAGPKA